MATAFKLLFFSFVLAVSIYVFSYLFSSDFFDTAAAYSGKVISNIVYGGF